MKEMKELKPSITGSDWTKKVDLACFVLTSLILAMIPMIFDKTNYQVFALPKAFLLKAGIGFIGFFWAANQLTRMKEFSWRVRGGTIFWPLLTFLLVYALATALSIDPWMSFNGVYGRFFGLQGLFSCFIAFLVLVTMGEGRRDIHLLLTIVFVSGSTIGGYAIFQYFGLDPFLWFIFPFDKVYSTTGNANFCGNTLAMVIPLSFYMIQTAAGKRQKFLYFLGTFLMLGGLMASTTRGAWAAVFLSSLAVFILGRKYSLWKTKQNFLTKDYSLVFFFIFIFILTAWFIFNLCERPENFFYPFPFLRLLYTFWPDSGVLKTKKRKRVFFFISFFLSTLFAFLLFFFGYRQQPMVTSAFSVFTFHESIRIFLWRDFFTLIKRHLFLGLGPETYRRAFMPFKSLSLALLSYGEEHDNPHNNLFSLWASIGIMGPLCLLKIIWEMTKGGFQVLPRKDVDIQDKFLGLSFLGIGISYFIWGIVGFDTVVNWPFNFTSMAAFALWQNKVNSLKRWHWEPIKNLIPKIRPFAPYVKLVFILGCFPIFILNGYLIYHHRKADSFFLQSLTFAKQAEFLVKEKRMSEVIYPLSQAKEMGAKALIYNPQESHYSYHMARLIFEEIKLEKNNERVQQLFYFHDKFLTEADLHPWAPESIMMERLMGHIMKKTYPEAIAQAEKLLEICPYRMDVRQILEKLYHSTQVWVGKQEVMAKVAANSELVLKFNSQNLFSRLFLTDIYLYQRDFEKAMDQAFFLQEDFPDQKISLLRVIQNINRVKKSQQAQANLNGISL